MLDLSEKSQPTNTSYLRMQRAYTDIEYVLPMDEVTMSHVPAIVRHGGGGGGRAPSAELQN